MARESPTLAVYKRVPVMTMKTAVLIIYYHPDARLFIRVEALSSASQDSVNLTRKSGILAFRRSWLFL